MNYQFNRCKFKLQKTKRFMNSFFFKLKNIEVKNINNPIIYRLLNMLLFFSYEIYKIYHKGEGLIFSKIPLLQHFTFKISKIPDAVFGKIMVKNEEKWIFLKLSGATLIPLMLWFIFSLNTIYDQEYANVVNFFTNSLSKFLFSIFIINAYFFSALSISEVFEDYIENDKIKNVANKLLYSAAVVIPLITIILISNL